MNKKKIETYLVPPLDQRQRLSDFAVGIFKTIHSKKGIKKAIERGLIYVNKQRGYTADYINGGESIDLYKTINHTSIDLKINVLFEDEFLAIVNKPAGILVSGNKKITLENALSNNLKISKLQDALERPEPIHRLDFQTSGALLIGKTNEALISLNKMFEDRQINKSYIAICIGEIPEEGQSTEEIDGKKALSSFKVLGRIKSDKYKFLNLLEIHIESGRRHQIRKHMLGLGQPVLGDQTYGFEGLMPKGRGMFLHAYSIKFIHPFTHKNIKINSPLPLKFKKIFNIEL